MIDYSVAFGGSANEALLDLISLPDGSVVASGWTSSTDNGFAQGTIGTVLGETRMLVSRRAPGTGAMQWTTYAGDFLPASGTLYQYGIGPTANNAQGFLAQLSADATTVLTRVYLGGSGHDTLTDLALDDQDRPVVTGYTTSSFGSSTTYPVTSANAYQTATIGGGASDSADAILTQFSATGDSLRYSSLLSGVLTDRAYGVAVDGSITQPGFAITPVTAIQTLSSGG